MTTIATIVEGHGEVTALPILLRRVCAWQTPGQFVNLPSPIRVHRDSFLKKDEEFRRYLLLAAAKCGGDGWVLVLLDADDDCPVGLSANILQQAAKVIPNHRISVVLANREFESWFIAAAASLDGHRGFSFSPAEQVDAETPRDAKGWMKAHMASKAYGETTDQSAFCQLIDLQLAYDGSRSFRKLCAEWNRQMATDPES